ncbi:ATP-binding protein [Ruania suaedae]|uniref:ATP-binding protein n=1 Tax=Ruania suaedae TaxID=2897774 RepID=UPI001E413D39|nr:ATP-binding protein [Ruania suaedae]UFU02847.1 ATP-binding protein [Ruania suaedae]
MTPDLIRRNASDLVAETLADTPVTVISGARQVGKSTLMQQLISGRNARTINLDLAVDRAAAERDPDGFAMQYPDGLLAIDEIQRVPALLTSLKAAVDQDRRPGRFIVTGSADLLSLRGAQESLAGRAQTIPLEGLSRGEVAGRVEDFAAYAWRLPTEVPADRPAYTRRDYLEIATAPSFPELREAPARARGRWMENYADRVLSKDTTDVSGISYVDRLGPLLDVLAARNGSEFVAARVAREVDIPERSVPAYLRAMQSVYLIRVVPGWSNNRAARAVRAPKVYLSDTGLAAHLAGVDVEGLEREVSSTLTGGFVEGFVVGELVKQRAWSQKSYSLSHYRDNHGREVDIVLEDRRREVVGVEVKSAATVGAGDFRGLELLRDKVGQRFVAGVVLYTGTRAVPFGGRLWALPLATLWEH